MIGTYARSLRHLSDNAEDNKENKVLIIGHGTIMFGCIIKTKIQNGKECLALFQNYMGDGRRYAERIFNKEDIRKYSVYFEKYRGVILLDEHVFQTMNIIILPDNFDDLYAKFCKNNRKLIEQVSKYCDVHEPYPSYMFSLIEDKPNLFVWAVSNIYRNRINISTISHIIQWNENYNKLCGKLSKGTITAYNGQENIDILENEMFELRAMKRANDVINKFNTVQKKILKSIELTPDIISILNKFSRLSNIKQINFIRKMSTIANASEILKQMTFLTNSKFDWNKESVIEYINNAENINAEIIENKDNILLVKVNDYETVKHLARATNWCISKNKKYWNDYIGYKENFSQYLIYNFNKKEDDKLSIIGFTIDEQKGITNAHNFVNDNLMSEYVNEALLSLNSFLPKNKYSIYSLLKENNLDINKLLSNKTTYYDWNKEEFMGFLAKYICEEHYNILANNDDSIILTIHDENAIHLIGNGYTSAIQDPYDILDLFIVADFSVSSRDSNRLIWGVISKDSSTNEESCYALYNIYGQTIALSFNSLLMKYNLPYDIICRKYNELNVFNDALSNINISILNNFLKDKSFIEHFKKSEFFNSNNVYSALIDSLFSYYSFDLIDTIYNNGLKLTDLIPIKKLNDFLFELSNNIMEWYYNCHEHKVTKKDFIEFNRGNLSKNLTIYIGYYIFFKKISDNEINNEIFKGAIENFYCDGHVTKMMSSILAKHIIRESIGKQGRFIKILCTYECDDAINIILSNKVDKSILNLLIKYGETPSIKEKIKEYAKKYSKEMSFSVS